MSFISMILSQQAGSIHISIYPYIHTHSLAATNHVHVSTALCPWMAFNIIVTTNFVNICLKCLSNKTCWSNYHRDPPDVTNCHTYQDVTFSFHTVLNAQNQTTLYPSKKEHKNTMVIWIFLELFHGVATIDIYCITTLLA